LKIKIYRSAGTGPDKRFSLGQNDLDIFPILPGLRGQVGCGGSIGPIQDFFYKNIYLPFDSAVGEQFIL
jgi:hypothetical protein